MRKGQFECYFFRKFTNTDKENKPELKVYKRNIKYLAKTYHE